MQFHAEFADYKRHVRLLAAILLLPLAITASAQTPAPPFVIESDDGDNRLQLGTVVQGDARVAFDDTQQHVTDTFTLRRMRAQAQGRVARHFEFYLNVDFAGGVVNVRDAYFDTIFSPAFRIRAGKTKAPFSYDRSIRAANILFGERGFTTIVAPDRDLGVELLGDLAGSRVSYAVAVTNGVIDGGSADGDTNDSKDVTARIVVRPWARTPRHPLSGLALAIAVNEGTHGPALPSFVSAGRQTFFSYAADAADSGRRSRWSPQAYYSHGPFYGYAELVRSSGEITKSGAATDIDHDAWQGVASWVITGEAADQGIIRPRVNFDPPSGHYGALQVVARVERLTVSRDVITQALASAGASRTADASTIGLAWYLNPYVKWYVGFSRTIFDGDASGPRRAENLVLGRAQLAF